MGKVEKALADRIITEEEARELLEATRTLRGNDS